MMSVDKSLSPELALCGLIEGRRCRFGLRPGANRVGRAASSEVLLPIAGVSMCHALIFLDQDGLRVEDLASKNGTFVNGISVGETKLYSDDEIRFGPVCLQLTEAASKDGALAVTLAVPQPADRFQEAQETPLAKAGTPAPIPPLAFPEGYVVGRSAAMIALYRQLLAVAASDLPVLLVGETGVGKEYLARILHASAGRRSSPFVGFNCAAIPAELLESELFGVGERVATGVAARPGKFRQAQGGTLFLDEIAEMSTALQAKILRVLQEREVDPVGARLPLSLDVRIVASTNIELDRLVREKAFRQDLYYRLAGLVVEIPPLRRRRQDIPLLVESFLVKANRKSGRSVRGITVRALERLAARPWPGNVRELEHGVRRLVHLCLDGQAISAELVEEALDSNRAFEPPSMLAVDAEPSTPPGEFNPQEIDLSRLTQLDLRNIENSSSKKPCSAQVVTRPERLPCLESPAMPCAAAWRGILSKRLWQEPSCATSDPSWGRAQSARFRVLGERILAPVGSQTRTVRLCRCLNFYAEPARNGFSSSGKLFASWQRMMGAGRSSLASSQTRTTSRTVY